MRAWPVGTIIGDIADVSRFPGRDHFASCNGTAPVEVSSGNRKIHRLSLRGNRRVNHAIHMAAITQLRHKHSEGRAYYEKKLTEGKTHKDALRSLTRKISDAIFARLQADARQAAPARAGAREGRVTADRVDLCERRPRLRACAGRRLAAVPSGRAAAAAGDGRRLRWVVQRRRAQLPFAVRATQPVRRTGTGGAVRPLGRK